MAESELLKTFLALEDEELRQRVQGAMVKYADYLQSVPDADPVSAEFARVVLRDPTILWPRMRVKVVYNGDVMSKLKLGRNGEVETYFVEDQSISYVVETAWKTVALESGQVPLPANAGEV